MMKDTNKVLQKKIAEEQGISTRQMRNRNKKEIYITKIREQLKDSPDLQATFNELAEKDNAKNRKFGISQAEYKALSELSLEELACIIRQIVQPGANIKSVLQTALPDHEIQVISSVPSEINSWYNELSKETGISKRTIISSVLSKFFENSKNIDSAETILLQIGINIEREQFSEVKTIENEFESILNIIGKSTQTHKLRPTIIVSEAQYGSKREAMKEYKKQKKKFIDTHGEEWKTLFDKYE